MSERKKDMLQSIMASLLAILAGIIVGMLVMIVVGIFSKDITDRDVLEGMEILIMGLLSKGRDAAGSLIFGWNGIHIGNLLFKSTPLIMTGLSAALAMKAGLFNIGIPGQYLMGIMASLVIALGIPTDAAAPGLVAVLAILGGMLAGAVWGAIPGILKAFLNVNEVITCILTNWIAANLVTEIFEGSRFINVTDLNKTRFIYKTSFNNVELTKLGLDRLLPGSQANAGILIVIAMAVVVSILINKSVFGYELRLCGSNRNAAKYCGINDNKATIISMALAGALAGMGAALYSIAGNTEFIWSTYQSLPAVGFNGIPVALLACLNPIGVVFSAMFMSGLEISGQQMAVYTAYNEYLTSLIIGVIVYFSAFSVAIKKLIKKAAKKKGEKS